MLKNTSESYGWLAKLFHWGMALALIGTVALAYTMMNFPKEDPLRGTLYNTHKSIGLTLLALVVVRFGWRLLNPVPELPQDIPKWQRFLAHVNILLLYALILSMTLSGFFMSYYSYGAPWFGLVTFKAALENKDVAGLMHTSHEIIAYCLFVSFGVHFLAALYHHFVRKDNVLRRIWLNKKA